MGRPVRLEPRRSLTPPQNLIWTSQRLQPDAPHQNMALLTRFDSAVDPDRLCKAVDTVITASDSLRTQIRVVDGVPHPAASPGVPSPSTHVRLREEDLDSWINERVQVSLDLANSAYESVVLEIDGSWAWWLNVHHVVIDAASSANLFRAVAAEYHGEAWDIPNYQDRWAEVVASHKPERVQTAADTWAMMEAPRSSQLYQPDTGATSKAERTWVDMAGSRQSALDRLLADRFRLLSPDLSLGVALATSLGAYLARLGNDECTIGIPIHHRSTPNAKAAIGPLVEFFPLHVRVEDDDTFADLQSRVARDFMKLLSNALPGTSPRQTFDVVLNIHGATLGDFGPIGATTRWIHPGHIDPHHRLRVQALDYDGSGTLELALDINHAVAKSDHRQRAAGHFASVLDAMLENPDRPIHRVGLLDPDELLLLEPHIAPGAGVPLDGMTPAIVGQRLQAHGDRLAIRWTAESGMTDLTSAQVETWIDTVATALRRAGFGTGDLIGIEMPIGIDAVIAIHAVLRAGAAFVPIDPSYPEARREHIRQDSGCGLVLANLAQIQELPVTDPEAGPAVVTADDLAYVIYTSGSTGLPKGVPISHRGLAEYLGFAYGTYVGEFAPVMPLFTSLSFDLTITTLFLPLLSGGVMTIHPEGGLPALREIVAQGAATLIKATPSHLELLVRMIDSSHPLSGLIVGGEAFMTDLADRLISTTAPGLKIWNEYGPTEAVVGCMSHLYDPDADPGPEVPIGTPAPGVGLHILDQWGQRVPLGVAGELYISRPGMTDGYLRRDELNAERFVDGHQAGKPTRLYRTGDLVRMLDADRMVYLGRIDQQIKVGGIRLEPGEIEHVAVGVEGVDRAVVGLWSPRVDQAIEHCVRCGLGSDVPDTVIDGDGVCSSCHSYDLVAPQAAAWFRDEEDLAGEIALARQKSRGDYDVIHLISGGKDSTYALYKLVEMGARVFAITLDNGFIAEVAKANVRRATQALGVDHEFVTIEGMDEIFRDSLERFSNVCNGCYKAIYTIALAKAEELGVPAIVTGLSRGQFFETRLVPEMFESDRFDVDAIDAMVREARHVYHATPDAVSEHMDVEFLSDPTIFDRINFIDFYRYVDVPLSELYQTLEGSGTWQRPPDSGRSTNCLINAAGIFVHQIEQGHHNYAAPYSWDVRLGHKTREEALFELDDPMDDAELAAITRMLADVGYEPRKPEVLTLWVEAADDTTEIDKDALRSALIEHLPSHAVPQAIEVVETIPLTTNGKVDTAALPAPANRRRANATGEGRETVGETEAGIAAVWESVLGLSEVTATEDFFALGGTSLHALEMIVRVSDRFGVLISESVAFTKRTVEELARHIDSTVSEAAGVNPAADAGLMASGAAIPELADGDLPLSAGEEAMLYEWRRDPGTSRYNVARLYRVPNDVDLERFDEAVRTAVEHQPTLLTSYGPRRHPLTVDSALRVDSVHSESATLDHIANRVNSVPFDLISGPLATVHHLTSDAGDSGQQRAVLVRTHHIVSDEASLDILWSHIDLAYRGEPLPALGTSYAAHGQWQRQRTPNPAEAWNPATASADLTTRSPANEPDGYLERASSVTVSELRTAAGTTLFASALAALGASLRPFHDGDQLEITATSSIRDHPSLEHVVGYFLNPLPLRLEVQSVASLAELALDASETLANALERRFVPFADLVRAARARKVAPPRAQVMLAVTELATGELDGREVHHEYLSSRNAVNDLTFFVQVRGDQLELGVEYRGSSVGKVVAQRMLDSFENAVRMLVESPQVPVSSCFVAPEPLFGGSLGADSPALTPDRIAATIDSFPDVAAVISGSSSLTYAEVDQQARSVAARLRAVGVGAGDRVAIVMPRSVELVPAIWACWLLGASYVPIDHDRPAVNVTGLLSAAEVTAAISIGEGHLGLQEVSTVLIDKPDTAVLPVSARHQSEPDAEAYVIFTSGSTGQPKGVPISHGNLAASNHARTVWYEDPVERFLLISSAGFDSSIVGLFWTLVTGGTIVIPTDAQVHDVDALAELIVAADVTHTLMVPTLWGALLARSPETLRAVRLAVVAGEACSPALVGRHYSALPNTELVNEYGPTEATVWSTAHRCRPSDAQGQGVPIGGPIPGMYAEVLEVGTDIAAPLDSAGELVVSGPSVSAGYITPGKADPFVWRDERPSYRTGDLVVRRPEGTLEFLGRVDSQLSIGGVRIEPAEIEQAISSLAGVDACLVGKRNDALWAWVETSALTAAEIREATMDVLASSHVPRTIVITDLPRNANGKVDRSKVSSLPDAAPPPATAIESSDQPDPTLDKLRSLFSAVFDGVDVGPDSDFFALGGDSLTAVALVTHLEIEFGRRVAIGELIDAPTPRALVSRVNPGDARQRAVTANPDKLERDGEEPETSRFASEDGLVEWLRSSGTGSPLVVLPPGGGNLMRYAPLVKALDPDIPVVGVRLPGADGRSVIVHTIQRQAQAMLDDLDSAGVTGPYRLLGWSTGGLLAWEMAHLLGRRGDTVELVTMVDTYISGIRIDDAQSISEKYVGLLRDEGATGVLSEGFRRASERTRFALARRRYQTAADLGSVPSVEDAERELGPVIRRAALNYHPEPLDVPVLYLSATESPDDVTVDPWAKLQYLRGFRAVEIDGVHFIPEQDCIIGPNKAHEAVAAMTKFLDEITGPRDGSVTPS